MQRTPDASNIIVYHRTASLSTKLNYIVLITYKYRLNGIAQLHVEIQYIICIAFLA